MRGKGRGIVRPLVLAAVLATALVLASQLQAFALLEDLAAGGRYESATNPGKGSEATWRWLWGNTWYPNLVITNPPSDEPPGEPGETLGFFYELHQLRPSGAGFVTPTFGLSSLSPKPDGSLLWSSFNLQRVNAADGWVSYPGATKAGEGLYGLSLLFYNQFRSENRAAEDRLLFGLDLTPPSPVEGLTSGVGPWPQANGWTEINWRGISWTRKGYDALSGVGGFKVKVNGEVAVFAQNVAPDVAYEPYASLVNTRTPLPQIAMITVEELPAGESQVEVITVDRATNESLPVKFQAKVDTDTPVVKIVAPARGALTPAAASFSVDASDSAGVSRVKYYVDNVFVGESKKQPFTLKVSLASFANGPHTLKAVAYDQIGDAPGNWFVPHIATATQSFVLDKTPPVITNLRGAPSPFYPRLRDGYLDNFVVGFSSSEVATAQIVVRNSSGKVVRTIKKAVPKGASAITWDGKSSDGEVSAGTFSWTLSLTDAAGNVARSSSRSAAIRFYEIVRISPSAVRITER